MLGEIGRRGQDVLSKSHAIIIGCGAIGSMVANNLTRAGIGKLTIVDRDIIEIKNLQRQNLYSENDLGFYKFTVAGEKLRSINFTIKIKSLLKYANSDNIETIIKGSDVVCDGTDNMETRYLINDACVKHKIPWVYMGAITMYGMSMPIIPGKTACFRCLFPKPNTKRSLLTCNRLGVIGMIPAIIASMGSVTVIKILMHKNDEIKNDLIIYDCWTNEFDKIHIDRNTKCRCCAMKNFEFLKIKKRIL